LKELKEGSMELIESHKTLHDELELRNREIMKNVKRIGSTLANVDREADIIKENSDVVLRWQGEHVEQMR
jgi:hypothetical protein